ncbi:hypothetical protein V8D89_001858, partial [Ganoderma adspersum]
MGGWIYRCMAICPWGQVLPPSQFLFEQLSSLVPIPPLVCPLPCYSVRCPLHAWQASAHPFPQPLHQTVCHLVPTKNCTIDTTSCLDKRHAHNISSQLLQLRSPLSVLLAQACSRSPFSTSTPSWSFLM